MEIKTTVKGGATIVQLMGSLDGNTVTEAQEKIMPLVSDKMSLVLDLEKCTYISSAGLRLLLMIAKQLSTQFGALGLSGISDEIKDVMEMTGFSNFFKTFGTVAEALEAAGREA